ncbi:MAG: inositol-3-phosphate synthase [Phycisphaerae bacterium]|nr:inositol-3-phosphate synthase [Phycisphaerae bacterium]
MRNPSGKTGLWLVGAAGNVAATVAVGLSAMRLKLTPPLGLATESAPVDQLDLAPLDRIVLGGHEISSRTAFEAANELAERSGVFTAKMLRVVGPDLRRFDREIRTGRVVRSGSAIGRLATRAGASRASSARSIIDSLRADLRSFATRNRLDRVVVVHVASTEPPFPLKRVHSRWSSLNKALSGVESPLPASSLYAVAAIEEGMPFVGFTPSLGCDVPGIIELAAARGVGIIGSDGKTGETLLKSVLAPMFRDRHFEIASWVGHNILGNGDGAVLDSAANKASKLRKKDSVIGSIVGGSPRTRTTIEYVESLHDWKTAWDHVHFRGFLGVKMILQFIWQGCDSILAAPLVIDLARLAEYHARKGRAGIMAHLACFFKSPMGSTEHDFSRQMHLLHDYVKADLASKPRKASTKHR